MTKEFSRKDLLKKIQEMEAELDRYRSVIDLENKTPIPYDQIVHSLPIATLQDVSERKQSEYRLIESEKRLSAFFEFMPYPIVIFTRKGRVYYLNPAFTRKFGWRLDELKGKTIPWDPPDLEGLPDESMETFFGSRGPRRFETKRLTKDGRIIDVIARGVSYWSANGKAAGVLMVQRDFTKERREARNNEAIHKISLALPAYPDLRELLDFITNEVRILTGSEVASTLLYDSDHNEMVFLSTSHEDRQFSNNSKELRIPLEKLISRHVIDTGEPLIENDLSTYGGLLEERDKILGFHAKSVAMVPLISRDSIIGILSASNKKIGIYEKTDIDLLNTIGSTVGLSIENAKVSKELQKAYSEVKSLNRAKDKLINHLSHEIKTPVAVLRGSIGILANQLQNLPLKNWQSALDRVYRNLNRIIEIQNEVSDIVLKDDLKIRPLISALLDQCTDILETFVESQNDNGKAVVTLRRRIDELLGPKELVAENIQLTTLVERRLRKLLPKIANRNVYLKKQLEAGIKIRMPIEVMNKVVDGLFRNAVENTPDQGTISVKVYKKGKRAILSVIDTGVGIREDSQQRIFEGFFTTRDIMAYSSKRPFDFNAGGKGADLLRMKIFSERYDFKIQMSSVRCAFIPDEKDICPGDIRKCTHCRTEADCRKSGGSEFNIYFIQ